jgi:sulfur carrier protein ThiS adenylyltransferase
MLTRDIRQRDLVPPQRLAGCHALVIGVGAIGRQVALQLAALGMPRLTLVDDDTVGIENLAAQGYWPADLQHAKVEATALLCRSIHPEAVVTVVIQRFGRSSPKRLALTDSSAGHLICFACVDSIATRKLLWESLRGVVSLWVDGRMAGETLRVLASDHPVTDAHYPSTLFEESQAYAGSCTSRSTIYTASIAAGLMLAQFTRFLRQISVERDQTLNLLACELSTL